MSSKSDFVPESFIKALRRGIKGYKEWPEHRQWQMAKLVWEAGMKRRAHKLHDGYIAISHTELYSNFGRGRGGFEAMNEALGVFEVTPNWHKDDALTKGYRLAPAVKALKEKYLQPGRESITRLIYLDGKSAMRPLKSLPKPIAAKEDDDDLGVTASAWRNIKIETLVPVDLDMLRELYGRLSLMHDHSSQDDIFTDASAEEIYSRIEWTGQLIKLARTNLGGRGHIIHRYAECKTGRLYARGVSLQTAPRIVRKAALHGLYDYDIENCHYSIFDQLCRRYGHEAEAVRRYLANKNQVREGIARRVGIHKEQAKMVLLALMFGARTNTYPKNAIPAEIGAGKAAALYMDHEFSAIAKDVEQGRRVILDAWPKRRSTLVNDLGKRVKLKTKPEIRMAHIIQGIEAKAIRAAVKLYPSEVVLLMHDGFVTTRPIDTELVQRRMYEATGYQLQLSGGAITLPADLDFSKQ